MSAFRRTVGALLALAASMAQPLQAHAQPAGLSNAAPASAGSQEVAKEGFQGPAPSPASDESKDASTLKLIVGGFVSQGNSRTIALTAGEDYFLRRRASQFAALAAVNYGRSAPVRGEPYATTVENYQARVRYDYFFARSVAGFAGASARRDRFQGLDLRLNLDPGVAYYFIDEKGHRLWAELGYDLQYDLRNSDFIDATEAAAPVPGSLVIAKSEVRHNVRAFVGYENELTETLKFGAGVEYLQNVQELKNARINADAALTAQVNEDFSIATTFSLKYDNNPLPGIEKTDVITALNLVYTMD
jgi:putative salt-induced outer membrane protein YdiY